MSHSLALVILLQTTAGAQAPSSATVQLQRGLVALLASQNEEVPGWPWEKAGTSPASNLGGVIALSLLELYGVEPDPATWVTLVQYTDHLRRAYADPRTLPFKADIELLARAGDAGLDAKGRAFAEELFGRVLRVSPRGGDEYGRIAKGRGAKSDIIGYDIALTLRAAVAVGAEAWALEVAQAALAAGRLSLTEPNNAMQVTSVGAMVHALSLLDRPEYRRRLELTARDLLAAQAPQGSWGVNDTQATAYAILGLRAVADGADTRLAADRGQAWLIATQLAAGDWAEYHDGMPEPFVGTVRPLVDAEALAALSARR